MPSASCQIGVWFLLEIPETVAMGTMRPAPRKSYPYLSADFALSSDAGSHDAAMARNLLGLSWTSEENFMIMPTAEVADEAAEWGRSAMEEPLACAETVLLVEDEQFVREVTSEVLRSAGYRVLVAKNAVEAMSAFERSAGVELLLTDVVLPGESGSALAARMRHADRRLKVLFVTGYPEYMEMAEAVHEECLAKPFSTGLLLRRVRQVLDREADFDRQTRAS